MKIIDFVILAVLAIVVMTVVYIIYRQKKMGIICGQSCGGCPLIKKCSLDPKKFKEEFYKNQK